MSEIKIKTVEDLLNELKDLIKHHPKFKKLPIIYASDAEGNEYYPVYNSIGLVKVENFDEDYLELMEILKNSEANAIIIN